MRRLRRILPAWALGLCAGTCFAGATWLVSPGSGTAAGLYGALNAGGVYGVAMGITAGVSRARVFRVVGGAALTRAERVTVVNMVRGVEHSNDWRLHQVAGRLARRLVARSNGPLALALAAVVIFIATNDSPRSWYLLPAFAVASALGIWQSLRRRAAARAYLGS